MFSLFTWIPVFTFFFYFHFFNGNWDWADTPYVQDAHSTWFLECSRLVMSFFPSSLILVAIPHLWDPRLELRASEYENWRLMTVYTFFTLMCNVFDV